ncbi:uncharacterized protein LOC133141459 [Conger conger]|uniref:uncharacterized protein LOC133141459 n=1 Tax=Conger conger TaxID=82655 RepID=UPI002A5A6DE2|nr:uncharacterized protein LOC133141459 [Conger conger]
MKPSRRKQGVLRRAKSDRPQESSSSGDSSDSGSDSDSSSDLIGPPIPSKLATHGDPDDIVGPPLPPGYRGSLADDDDDEEDMQDEDDDNPVKRIPDTHEITLQHGTKTVSALGLDPSGARLVTGGYDYDVRFWDFAGMDAALQAFRSLQPCECHQIKSLQYSVTGDVILVVAGSAQAKVLDRDGFPVLECVKGDQYIVDMANTKGHTAMLNSGCWHPKIKEEFLTCSNDGTVRTWDLNSEKKHKSVFKPRSLQGKRVTPTCCSYSRDGKLIAASRESRREDAVYTSGSASCISVQIKTVSRGPRPAHEQVSAGRHFINVINLEDEDLLEHLPSRQASASPTGPTSTPVSPHTHRPGAPGPNHTSTEQMTVETVLDTQLEPSERPSPPVIPGLWGISEPGQDKEPLGLLVEIEPLSLPNSSRLGLGLRDSLGLSVSFRDVEEQSTSSRGGVGRSADAFDSMMERSGKFSDGPLDLSDTGDTLTELGGLRGASTYSLGPSDSLRDRFLRRGEQNNMGVEEEEQREELRAWMKKKQKERIAEYRRQREEKREQEHRPFTPSSTQNLTSRDLSTNKKMKEKKEKTLLLEHHTLRAREACSLITELLKPSPALPTLTKAQPSQSTNQSSRRPKAQPSQSTNQSSRRPKAHPSQSTNQSSRRAAPHGYSRPEGRRGRDALFHTSASPGRTAGVRSISAQRGEHQLTTRRMHRPGALPDARLTRWGVQDTRGRRPGKGWMKGIRPPLKEDRMRREREVREEVEEESDDEQLLSPWNPPLEIRRLLGLDNQGSVEERSGAPGSGAGVWLKGLDRDSPSESTGSILSKLDWTAIEKMVAEEDQV